MGIASSAHVQPILNPLILKNECDHDDWSEGLVSLGNGNVRNCMQWIPKSGNIKGLVIIVHGLYEHAIAYDRLAHGLTLNRVKLKLNQIVSFPHILLHYILSHNVSWKKSIYISIINMCGILRCRSLQRPMSPNSTHSFSYPSSWPITVEPHIRKCG